MSELISKQWIAFFGFSLLVIASAACSGANLAGKSASATLVNHAAGAECPRLTSQSLCRVDSNCEWSGSPAACVPKNSADGNGAGSGNCPTLPETLTVTHTFSEAGASLTVIINYKQTSPQNNAAGACQQTASYVGAPATAATAVTGAFPADFQKAYAAFQYTATIDYNPGASNGPYVFRESIATQGVPSASGVLPASTVTITQTAAAPEWSKDEGFNAAFGDLSSESKEADCRITPSGNQPRPGVYSVILTKPAPCDFRLPQITVSGFSVADVQANNPNPSTITLKVAIGIYWQFGNGVAHNFPLTTMPVGAPLLDNGFILVQPDHTSYLLVDGGWAWPDEPAYKEAAKVASMLSQQLGFGPTTLQQPNPGTAAANYTDATLFKKGSVIALYDDTPDMHGNVDVDGLVQAANQSSGIALKWTAK